MTRREEVEVKIISADGEYCDSAWIGPKYLRCLARTLADEVDERDAIIDNLLEMLEPGDPPCDCISEDGPDAACCGYNIGDWGRAVAWVESKTLHARACEIAGRVE